MQAWSTTKVHVSRLGFGGKKSMAQIRLDWLREYLDRQSSVKNDLFDWDLTQSYSILLAFIVSVDVSVDRDPDLINQARVNKMMAEIEYPSWLSLKLDHPRLICTDLTTYLKVESIEENLYVFSFYLKC
jgi:hypothetical protein